MKTINHALLKQFVCAAGDRLTGDWVILGGSVLAIKGHGYRSTNDIDLAGPKEASQRELLILMEVAEELGLPVEAINLAAAFFLLKIKDWRKRLAKIHTGKTATFYCPDINLYLLLKIQRLSETDLSDCLHWLNVDDTDELDSSLIQCAIKKIRGKQKNPQWLKRSEILSDALKKHVG